MSRKRTESIQPPTSGLPEPSPAPRHGPGGAGALVPQHLSIRLKLSLIITLTSGIGLLLACATFLAHDLVSFRSKVVEDLSGLAEILGANCAPALARNDPEAAGESLVTVSADPQVVSAFLFSPGGVMLGGYLREDTVDENLPRYEPPGHRFEDGNLILFHRVFLDGELVGTLYLQSDLRELRDRIRRQGAVVLVVLMVAVLVTLLVAGRMQSVISRPILALFDAARAASIGKDYSIRVPQESSDEVGLLTGAFNDMLEQIQSRDAALRTAHDELRKYAQKQTRVAFQQATGRKEAEEALRQSEEQLRQAQKMEAIGRLAGGVAHDFNNLLTIITGYSDMMLEQLNHEDPLREKLEEVRKASERAGALTRQLLAFSRKQVLKPEVLSLNAVVQDLEKMLRRVIGEDIELAISLSSDLANTRADRGQIEQVILNLAVNARDAMREGGRLSLETRNVETGIDPVSHVLLRLTDTGCGMDEEIIAQIFEPFFTTKGEGKGTGLGLSTVYGIVKQSGGTIQVASKPGKGTTFEILFPRVDEVADPVERRSARSTSGGTETILVVEDETAVRKLARDILMAGGYTVLEAPHGGEAVLICERHPGPIHLMVTDVVMPRMNGFELRERLRPLRPRMKVLYMSGHTDHVILDQGRLKPGLAFLQKPFTPQGLSSKVRETLSGIIEAEPLPA